jgi:DNA replication protein DnaC
MALQLDKNTLAPILEAAGFSKTNANIWMIDKEGIPYGVDFAKNTIFRLEGMERILQDKDDEYLNTLKDMCVNGTVQGDAEENHQQCEICNSNTNGSSKDSLARFGQVLCSTCHSKAKEHDGIPPAVLIVGWEAYEKQKKAEESTEEQRFPDDVHETEDSSKDNKVPEKDKPIDVPGTPKKSKEKTDPDTPILDLIEEYVGNDVLEVFGDTGTGKSKFVQEIAREAIASGKSVFFLDTEANLTKADIASMKGCQYKYTPVLAEIATIISNLPKVDVVILDSIGFPVLTTYARLTTNQKGNALLELIAIFGDLKTWAYKNNGVAVVTNQPESEFNKDKNHVLRPFGDKSQFAAKEIWKTEFTQRTPTLTKSKVIAFRSRSVGQKTRIADIEITASGVEVKA